MSGKRSGRKAHHADPRYVERSATVRALASSNPLAICWRCGRTIAQHDPHKTGRPVTWHGGHTIDGVLGPAWTDVTRRPPAGRAWIAAEASTCNIAAGNDARRLNADTGYDWP